jgi:hypothetical protein
MVLANCGLALDVLAVGPHLGHRATRGTTSSLNPELMRRDVSGHVVKYGSARHQGRNSEWVAASREDADASYVAPDMWFRLVEMPKGDVNRTRRLVGSGASKLRLREEITSRRYGVSRGSRL